MHFFFFFFFYRNRQKHWKIVSQLPIKQTIMNIKKKIDTVFQFQQVDENDIFNIINNLTPKTTSGIDNLSIKIHQGNEILTSKTAYLNH